MSAFPPGAPNFQLPRPHRGVVYFHDGQVIVQIDGRRVVACDVLKYEATQAKPQEAADGPVPAP